MKTATIACFSLAVMLSVAADGDQSVTSLVSELQVIADEIDQLTGDEYNQALTRACEIGDDLVQMSRSNPSVGPYLTNEMRAFANIDRRASRPSACSTKYLFHLAQLLARVDRSALLSVTKQIYVSSSLDAANMAALLNYLSTVRAQQRESPRRDDFRDQDMATLFIEVATDTNSDLRALARTVLLGRAPDGPYAPLDRQAGEQLMRQFIQEEANLLEKDHGYRLLLSQGLASNEYTSFLEAHVANTNEDIHVRLHFATKLHKLGGLSETELQLMQKECREGPGSSAP